MAELIKAQHNGIIYYRSPVVLKAGGTAHGFFTKIGGVSKGTAEGLNFRFKHDDEALVTENYRLAAACLGRGLEDVVRTHQTHTARVEAVEKKLGFVNFDPENGVDGLVTNVPGVVLAGFYADCQLIIFSDPVARCVAVCHSGWRGVASGIAKVTLQKMKALYGSQPENIVCGVSPSICQNCFECDGDVPEIMNAAYGAMAQKHTVKGDAKWYIDLKAITRDLLISEGIKAENMDISSLCPCCGDPSEYWSHRRNGNMRGVHAGMIVLEEK